MEFFESEKQFSRTNIAIARENVEIARANVVRARHLNDQTEAELEEIEATVALLQHPNPNLIQRGQRARASYEAAESEYENAKEACETAELALVRAVALYREAFGELPPKAT